MEDILKHDLDYLANQFRLARPVLFTGAGFSLGVKNITGANVPSYTDVKTTLWNLCFPGKPINDESSIQDIYDIALIQRKADLAKYLKESLTIDADSIPDWYEKCFNFPWKKCYTLNIDDLEIAISRKYKLNRRVSSISGTSDKIVPNVDLTGSEILKIIHLNGAIEDIPQHSIFSTTQYAMRISKHDTWYTNLVNELVVFPFIFIGTKLNEPPLWQHLELKKRKDSRGEGEQRAKSYIVTPTLDPAKAALLSAYHVIHIPMKAEDFINYMADKLGDSIAEGQAFIREYRKEVGVSKYEIQKVGSLLTDLNKKTEFLLGEFPQWADVHQGRAIFRAIDTALITLAENQITRTPKTGILAITGTAGAGKSTCLMRLAYTLNNKGKSIGWLDRDSQLDTRNIKEYLRDNAGLDVLCIDEIDSIGMELTSFLVEVSKIDKCPLIIFSIRSGKIDRLLNTPHLGKVQFTELTVPHLEDQDIDNLIEILRKEHRLGVLTKKSLDEQRTAFKREASRVLIAAMIKATSGKDLKDKLMDELAGLDELQQRVYSLLVVTSYIGIGISKDDILVGIDAGNSGVLKAIEALERRHLVSVTTKDKTNYRTLNKIIAESIFEQMANRPELRANIISVGQICAAKLYEDMPASNKYKVLLRRIINHDFLIDNVGVQDAQFIYGTLEDFPVICDDEHYWLQRGSLEVQIGSITLAEFFLSQARELRPTSALIRNEFAYMNFKKAILTPGNASSPDLIEKAIESLQTSIKLRPHDPYPYGILGKQGLEWSKRGFSNKELKRLFLERLRKIVEEGQKAFPKNKEINGSLQEIQREYLETVL